MRNVLLAVVLAMLTGCAGLGDRMRAASASINKGVARSPDATIDVRVKQ